VLSRDVAISAWILGSACALMAVLTWRAPGPSSLRRWFVVVIGGAGLAALAAGTIRGFYAFPASATVIPADAPLAVKALWSLMGIAIGAVGLAAWNISAGLLVPDNGGRRLALGTLAVLYGLYAVYVAAAPREYWVSIAAYLPPTLALLAALAWRAIARAPGALLGVAGLVTTFVAAAQQQLQIGIHPVYFNYNALYHLLQGLGLVLLQLCAVRLRDPAGAPAAAGLAEVV